MIKNLKKETTLFVFIMVFASFLIIPQVTGASFLDILNQITGQAATETADVTITVANDPPVIGNVTLDEADNVAITENGNKSFVFSFVATDPDSNTPVDNNSATANISRGGETTRYNNTNVISGSGNCVAVNSVGSNGVNFSCTIEIVFYDGAGEWNISVEVNDTNNNHAQNNTKTFTIGETTSISLSTATFTFPNIVPNQDNVSSSVNMTITNIGNDDISGRDATGETINITGITLVPSTGSTFIPASNFTIGQVNSTSGHIMDYCDPSIVANVTRLQNTSAAAGFANFSGSINGSAVLAQANSNVHTIGICLIHAPNDLTGTTYTTTNSGSWSFLIF